MNKYLLFTIFSIMVFSNFHAQWVQTSGPYGEVNAIYAEENFVIAGSDKIYTSTDNGISWTKHELYMVPPTINSIIAANGAYIAATSRGIYRFNGEYWEIINFDVIASKLFYDGRKIWAAANSGVVTSSDNGESWETVLDSDGKLYTTLFVYGDTVFVGTAYNGLIRSTDYGNTWSRSTWIDSTATIYAFGLINNTLWASVNGNPYKSLDFGNSWIGYFSGMDAGITSFTSDGSNYIYAGTYNGVYVASDPFYGWSKIDDDNFPFNNVKDLIFVPGADAGLYVAQSGGVYRMRFPPNGSWQGIGIPGQTTDIFTKDNVIYASTESTIQFSNDGGITWNYSDENFPVYDDDLITEFTYDGDCFYVTQNSKVLRLCPDDSVWTEIFEDTNSNYSINFTARNNVIYAGGSSVWYSNDNGTTWNEIGAGLPEDSYVSKLYKGENSLYVSLVANGIYKYNDSTFSWEAANGGIESATINEITEQNGYLFATQWGMGIYRSSDEGETWTQINNGIYTLDINTVYSADTILFVGTDYSQVYVSLNNGESWSLFNENLNEDFMRQPVVKFTADDEYIYVATANNGVWKRPLSDVITDIEENTVTPTEFSLSQNYPNPFNPTTTIKYSIAKEKLVSLKIYDMLGREISELVNTEQAPGNYSVQFDASKLSSGIYFYTLQAGDFIATKKMLLLK